MKGWDQIIEGLASIARIFKFKDKERLTIVLFALGLREGQNESA